MDIQNRLPAALVRFFPGVVGAVSVFTGLAALPVCGYSDELDTTTLCIHSSARDNERRYHQLQVELAVTPEQRRRGLMQRENLAEDGGMLFVFDRDKPSETGFWMYQTLIPLDIAYLNAAGSIVSIQSMTPCDPARGTSCPSYPSGKPFRYALEVNEGYFGERGIDIGERVFSGNLAGECAAGQVTPLAAKPVEIPWWLTDTHSQR